jgi:hypothetical protein
VGCKWILIYKQHPSDIRTYFQQVYRYLYTPKHIDVNLFVLTTVTMKLRILLCVAPFHRELLKFRRQLVHPF